MLKVESGPRQATQKCHPRSVHRGPSNSIIYHNSIIPFSVRAPGTTGAILWSYGRGRAWPRARRLMEWLFAVRSVEETETSLCKGRFNKKQVMRPSILLAQTNPPLGTFCRRCQPASTGPTEERINVTPSPNDLFC